MRNGKEVRIITLRNANGMEASITNFGGRITSILVPDNNGQKHDVVLGFDDIESYYPENHQQDFGATIGRYANRIGNGRLVIEGRPIQLPQNNGSHCLHGGPDGWQYQVFDIKEATEQTLLLHLTSPDGDNGFPGCVSFEVRFALTTDNALRIDYCATTDAATVINATNHTYFNLNADGNTNILNHILWIDADRFTRNDATCLPTGEISPVDNTPLDFRTPKSVGQHIEADDEQIRNGSGYDHNWILNTRGSLATPCARLSSPNTGITMEVFTDQPGMQVYTGNFLDGSVVGKYGKRYQRRNAICLETQHYPDSPNHPEWTESNTMLRPGEEFRTTTIFKFSHA